MVVVLFRLLICAAAAIGAAHGEDFYSRAISSLHGTPADPNAFPHTLAGFSKYLQCSGVRTVTAADLTQPNHPEVAARLGFHEFLPDREWWPRGAALALMVEKIRAITGEQVRVRNWWRPQAYNLDPKVGGAQNGDHPTANAVDLDFLSREARVKAEAWLRMLDRTQNWLGLSLGLGDRTTHVGIGSTKGRREWHYAGWRQS